MVISGSQIAELLDESLTEDIIPAHSSNPPLSDHVNRLIALDRSPAAWNLNPNLAFDCSNPNSAFDCSVVLLQNIVQVDGRAVDRRQIRVDHPRLMRGGIARSAFQAAFLQAVPYPWRVNSRLSASASRKAESRKSIVAPVESMARHRRAFIDRWGPR